MKFTLTRDVLQPALGRTIKAVEKRNTIPLLGNVLLRAGNGALTLTGTDLDAEITTTIAAEVSEEGATTLPAGVLDDFIKKLPAGRTLTFAQDDGRCTIQAGRTRIVLPSLPAADFPSLTGTEPAARFVLPADRIAATITRTGFAISREETRYYLGGIHMHTGSEDEGPALYAVATDGHRLARETIPQPEGAGSLPPIIIPRRTVDMLAGILKSLGNVDVEIAASATHISFVAGPTTLASKLIDGTFPDYLRVIPPANTNIATLDADELRASVDLLSSVASERGRAVKFHFARLDTSTLEAAVNNPDAGDATDTVGMEFEGQPVEIGFNARYVLDLLAILPGSKIRIALGESTSPALITATDHEGWQAVLMPMRV